MNILHLANTSLAGAPTHLSGIINKYTEHNSKCVLKRYFSSHNLKNLKWKYDIVTPSPQQLNELIDWTDVLHLHQVPYPGAQYQRKPNLLQFHGQPNSYRPNETRAEFNGRKLVIAQYHARFYTDAKIVPNMIDIWDEKFKPKTTTDDQIKIFYGIASEVPGTWADKGSTKTKQILDEIARKYRPKVQVIIRQGQPYDEVIKIKKECDITIDECVTGSYHLSSLEGLSFGHVVLNNVDQQTNDAMKNVCGVDHPFDKCNMNGLRDKLEHYIENPYKLNKAKLNSRSWVEKHWDPKVLVNKFIDEYKRVING